MSSEIDNPVASSEPVASRRDFVTAVTVAAAAVGTASAAQSQTQGNLLRFSNPDGMTKPTAYSQLVEVNGPHRIVFVAGQTGVDASGKVAQDFHAQAIQAFENIRTALKSVGGDFEHVVKITTYLTDIEQNADAYRWLRADPRTRCGTTCRGTPSAEQAAGEDHVDAGGLLHRKFGGLLALENAANIATGQAKCIRQELRSS
jgi:enamine deaminase RidA (YjgF/YER057c/UK114 family)